MRLSKYDEYQLAFAKVVAYEVYTSHFVKGDLSEMCG